VTATEDTVTGTPAVVSSDVAAVGEAIGASAVVTAVAALWSAAAMATVIRTLAGTTVTVTWSVGTPACCAKKERMLATTAGV